LTETPRQLLDEAAAPAGEGDWPEGPARTPVPAEPTLVIDVDGFEGPLDLLLTLARNQKVDLGRISILALADQYLAFIEQLRQLRLEMAADYLVMAAWLAYLKSRLLLPEPVGDDDEPTAEELAEILAFRLRRLEAMREAAGRLVARDRLGRDVFPRGAPEPVAIARLATYDARLYDLLAAYAAQRQRHIVNSVQVRRRAVWALADAREILERLLGRVVEWAPVESFLIPYMVSPEMRPTVRASAFSAALELVREGRLELRQSGAFQPLWIRAASRGPGEDEPGGEPVAAEIGT
jgi:segregation and condensation protein A